MSIIVVVDDPERVFVGEPDEAGAYSPTVRVDPPTPVNFTLPDRRSVELFEHDGWVCARVGEEVGAAEWMLAELPDLWHGCSRRAARLVCTPDGHRRVVVSTVDEHLGIANDDRSRGIRCWLRGGLCPLCSQRGDVDLAGGFSCPTHGPYQALVGEPRPHPLAVAPEAFLALEDGLAWAAAPADGEAPEWGPLDEETGRSETAGTRMSSWDLTPPLFAGPGPEACPGLLETCAAPGAGR